LKSFLDGRRLAHLATPSRDGKPRVTPIWYLYDNGFFYFTTRLGRLKGKQIQRDPAVAVSIATDNRPYRAVCAFGRVEIVKNDRDKWLERISSRYGRKAGKSWLTNALRQPDRVVMMLIPERVLSWHYGRGDSSRQEKGESMATAT
jgi:PPOX class probable F420-dependent enzyme